MVVDESIYNLISVKRPKQRKPPRYRSKHCGKLAPSASTFGASAASQVKTTNYGGNPNGPPVKHGHMKGHANFGRAKEPLAGPSQFMKKYAGHTTLAKPAKFTYHDTQKQPVPKKSEKPVMGLVTTKNFVKTNALTNILSKPPPEKAELAAREVDAGEPKVLHAEHGRVPEYLKEVKKEVEAEYAYVNDLRQREQQHFASVEANVQMLDPQEKEDLVYALKQKWDEVNKKYQLCTHSTVLDTVGKVRRKEQYEAELSQIEADIKRLDTTAYVFVRSM